MSTPSTKNSAALVSLAALATVAIIALLPFFYKFNGPLSDRHEVWAAFGSYISGTIGVPVAFMAVIWLIISVSLQKTELERLKKELSASAAEQRKQTKISALAALISSSRQSIASHQNDLIALNSGGKHLHPMLDDRSIHDMIDREWEKLAFYQSEIESYLDCKYAKETKNEEMTRDGPF